MAKAKRRVAPEASMPATPAERRKTITRRRPAAAPRTAARASAPAPGAPGDRFFRDMVWSMRTGVLAITVDGRIAVMNGIAYRVLNLEPRPTDIGRPYA